MGRGVLALTGSAQFPPRARFLLFQWDRSEVMVIDAIRKVQARGWLV